MMSSDGTPRGASRVERYRVPAGSARSEIEIKNSVFFGTVDRARDVRAVEAVIARVRAEFPDANHHAWAYRLSLGPQGLIGSSDDGEPGGTAGRPMLAILEGSGLVEVVAVGTRYFGGIKLGTGGLVRAYGGVVREALLALPSEELVLHRRVRFGVDYGLYGALQYLLPRQNVRVEEEAFAERVTLTLAIPYDRWDEMARQVREMTNGQVDLEHCQVGEGYDVVGPTHAS